VPKADPYDVLGVRPGASQATIKAAWRKLARAHHPDVSGSDAASLRAATRRMAQINAAYEALRDGVETGGRNGKAGSDRAAAGESAERPSRRRGGPPPPKPTRPVTGRVDTAATFRARNRTTTPPGARHPFNGHQPPARPSTIDREPLRASDPSGPLRRGRLRRFRPASVPDLEVASAQVVDFGKFRGHSLGEIAAFEPSYIDWIASTITRDAALVAAARVVRDELDRRGVSRNRQATERQRRETERQRQEWIRIFGNRDGE
jgi:curved DNA-binding protein CbpA